MKTTWNMVLVAKTTSHIDLISSDIGSEDPLQNL